MQLSGQRALVTGATSGIGQAIAEAFAREGASVIVTGRDAARAAQVVDSIQSEGGTAVAAVADLSDPAGVETLVAAVDRLGPLDILVNNAGIYPFGPTPQVEPALFDAVMGTNLRAPYFLTAALAPRMAARGRGRIINITTIAAHIGTPTNGLYGASKAALELLTKTWAAEFGPSGVNVNAIAPGPVHTPGTAPVGELLEQFAKTLPASRPGTPEEIAAAALFLAGESAAFVHGTTLFVDGGAIATRP
jgi:NAD(P)-dependent dehydrogenase (short-subunit alcohol dehydrogenase family)